MNVGEWVAVDGYDGQGIEMALVVAASGERRVPENEVEAIIAESPYAKVRRVTWRAVTPDDHDALSDDSEYHEQGTGDRWVEVILCGDEEPEATDG